MMNKTMWHSIRKYAEVGLNRCKDTIFQRVDQMSMLYFPSIERKSPIFFDLSRRFCVKILAILIEPLNLSARLSKGYD